MFYMFRGSHIHCSNLCSCDQRYSQEIVSIVREPYGIVIR
jgi:hypothetical protein